VSEVLLAFLPIWVLTALGWVAARAGALGSGAEQVLARFVFLAAMPALLFTTLVERDPASVLDEGIVAFAVSTYVICAAGAWLARRRGRRSAGQLAISGMSAGYVNAAYLGIPVAVQVLGDPAFMVSAAVFQLMLVTPLILAALDRDAHDRTGGRLRSVLLLPVRTPIVAASVLALIIAALGWEPPPAVLDPLDLLGAAAVPVALFSLGMSLHGGRTAVRTEMGEVSGVVLLKVVGQPALAYAVARFGFGLDGADLLAVVLCAALPTAQNTYIYASHYGVSPGRVRDAVLMSTILSMVSLSVVALALS
jgi:hypothetical protein